MRKKEPRLLFGSTAHASYQRGGGGGGQPDKGGLGLRT